MRQALDANLVPFVLGLLDKPLNIDNQAAIKAQLVNALKGGGDGGCARQRRHGLLTPQGFAPFRGGGRR